MLRHYSALTLSLLNGLIFNLTYGMVRSFLKNSCSIIFIVLFVIGFGGLNLSPPFFVSQDVLAANFQSSVTIPITVTVCGNENVETGEVCDDGANNGQYGYCNSACSGQTAAPPPSGGSGGGAVYIPPPIEKETKVILQGKAYPGASITVLRDGKVVTTKKADSQADFKVVITDVTAGIWTFGLWAEDKDGRRSITFSFTTTIKKDMTTTIGGIFIPPTIELEKVRVSKGEILNILGQTAPESEITISVESPQITKKTEADEEGVWDYPFDTSLLAEGLHTTRAKAKTPEGLLSSYSKVLSFYVGRFGVEEIRPRADFNKDGKTNLVDFSVMLYWWGKYNPAVDQNQNGIVDLPDFSILMYWWTG